MEKVYLVVVHGKPEKTRWTCRLKLAPDPRTIGRMRVEEHGGQEAETHFELLQGGGERASWNQAGHRPAPTKSACT